MLQTGKFTKGLSVWWCVFFIIIYLFLMPGNYLGKKQQETSGDSREDERTSKPQWICLGEMKKRIFPELRYGDQ